LKAVEETIAIMKRVITNTFSGENTSKPKVPELKSFSGAKSSEELENFLWDMKQ
jgi:hypothetical protein